MSTVKTYPLNIGPTHPAFKEPIRFNFQVDGERITECDIDFGYTHRGIERIAQERNFVQVIYLLERVCGICSFSHPLAYCLAIEQAAEIEVPPRARYIRTIIGELERLHSHLLWSGVFAHQLGFDSLFYYTWTVREKVLDCLEAITGNRINYGMLAIGGVRRDITPSQYPVIREVVDHYRELYSRLNEVLLNDLSVQMRCQGIGVLTREDAVSLCAVGPTARASGVRKDVRVDYPVNAYPDMEDLLPVSPLDRGVEPAGDVYSRILVRVLEILQSIEILNFCIDRMPEGGIVHEEKTTKLLNQLKKLQGEGIGRYEAPRGEVSHYDLIDKREGPVQIKVKAPTYSNGITWGPMLMGAEIADIPVIVASIDPCVACADRMCRLTARDGTGLQYEELRLMGVEKMKRVAQQCRG